MKELSDTTQNFSKELNINIQILESIYDHDDFGMASLEDYPYRPKQHSYDISRRYTPRVLLGFGKYSHKTLYQVYQMDKSYFYYLFQENILHFGSMKTSPKVEYTNEDTN